MRSTGVADEAWVRACDDMRTGAADRAQLDVDGDATAIDVAFDLVGQSLPADYAYPLSLVVPERLPWLAEDPCAGIHLLHTVATDYGVVLLPRRAKLVLRIARERSHDARALSGTTLRIGAAKLGVGRCTLRPLRAWGTLYALQVTTGAAGEQAFAADVDAALGALGARCGTITGKARRAHAGAREIAGFGIVLHGLAAGASLRVQSMGLGGERAQGWGIFVPHKTIAAAT